jgi:hypothetical protein
MSSSITGASATDAAKFSSSETNQSFAESIADTLAGLEAKKKDKKPETVLPPTVEPGEPLTPDIILNK